MFLSSFSMRKLFFLALNRCRCEAQNFYTGSRQQTIFSLVARDLYFFLMLASVNLHHHFDFLVQFIVYKKIAMSIYIGNKFYIFRIAERGGFYNVFQRIIEFISKRSAFPASANLIYHRRNYIFTCKRRYIQKFFLCFSSIGA